MIPFIEDVDGAGVRHTEIFRLALLGKANNKEWKELLANFRACVDYPTSFFYKVGNILPLIKIISYFLSSFLQ